MESSGAGALAAQAAPLPTHSQTPDPLLRLTTGAADMDVNPFHDSPFVIGDQRPGLSIETPVHAGRIDHFQASNVRERTEAQHGSPTSADAARAANILANPTNGLNDDSWLQLSESEANNLQHWSAPPLDSLAESGAGDFSDEVQWAEGEDTQEEEKDVKAYAKLAFPDGDYFISTLQVTLGRDLDFWRRHTKEERRSRRAQHDLAEYRLEPSQPSQPDDGENQGPSSKSSHSLEGRPAKALPSNFSEQGGAVSYANNSDDEVEARRARRKRRILNSKSSSTTSVAPASLHPSMMGNFNMSNPFSGEGGSFADQPSEAFVPVHPQKPEDIKKISKNHLLFRYNFEAETWEVQILGSGAMINDQYRRRDEVVALSNHDQIVVASLEVVFKLPDADRGSPGPSRGTFASDLDDEDGLSPIRMSPIRRLSQAVDVDSDDEDATPLSKVSHKPKLKLSLKKKKPEAEKLPESKEAGDAGAILAKPKPKQKEKEASRSPEAVRKTDKAGKKPKEATKEPVETPTPLEIGKPEGEELQRTETQMSPQASAPVIEPGSIFEGVAPDELPQKRKGPGRPPKNGLISKRDQALVKRKQKEYEKHGKQPPGLDELVAIVRAETKAKEAAAKAAARGEAPPDMPVVQSIETEALPMPAQLVPESAVAALDAELGQHNTSATPVEPMRRSSPKPKRIVKSPSPMKPESEYTEEEMKKPTITYVHILDEVLRDHPIGKADLQELYDRICKRYPHFKYKTGTSGWQSSVRHNLLQHERFKEDGRSGKGRLWAINWDYPLEKEKKRRVTPPPRPAYAMQNGQFPPMPYGAPYGGASYAQPNVNGQPQNFSGPPQPGGPNAYYSPYAPGQYPPAGQQSAQTPVHHGQQPADPAARPSQTPNLPQGNASNTASGSQPTPQQPPGQQQRQASSAPAPQFQGIVDEIMSYRSSFLAPYQPDTDAFKQHDEMFKKCTNYMSNIFHGTGADAAKDLSAEERPVYDHLQAIFNKYQHLKGPPSGSQSGTPVPGDGTPGPSCAQPEAGGGNASGGNAPTASVQPQAGHTGAPTIGGQAAASAPPANGQAAAPVAGATTTYATTAPGQPQVQQPVTAHSRIASAAPSTAAPHPPKNVIATSGTAAGQTQHPTAATPQSHTATPQPVPSQAPPPAAPPPASAPAQRQAPLAAATPAQARPQVSQPSTTAPAMQNAVPPQTRVPSASHQAPPMQAPSNAQATRQPAPLQPPVQQPAGPSATPSRPAATQFSTPQAAAPPASAPPSQPPSGSVTAPQPVQSPTVGQTSQTVNSQAAVLQPASTAGPPAPTPASQPTQTIKPPKPTPPPPVPSGPAGSPKNQQQALQSSQPNLAPPPHPEPSQAGTKRAAVDEAESEIKRPRVE
ncbi:hypothetical protein B0A50_02394 [Salinomyces thailandicus]|uniref:Fork-head domain-containing protein n=1 Tax=Salinomyces thailandicus TaxID=706561 RepID=A0A4U0U6R3_9PEZI|nr:hypothetical protein B0A50_02394 [Salinomyces thailandica]